MNGMEAGHSDIDVSIVIVNYRVKYFLEQTVRSAKEALAGFSGEIIVVDNNSGDDSIEHLRKCFPDVIVIENRRMPVSDVPTTRGSPLPAANSR